MAGGAFDFLNLKSYISKWPAVKILLKFSSPTRNILELNLVNGIHKRNVVSGDF
jgi:hypothetical protein